MVTFYPIKILKKTLFLKNMCLNQIVNGSNFSHFKSPGYSS